ncbi:transaldolase [Nitrospira moscoviensis]|nr:transaldolase [Nitrospira moscoviensis]
MNRLAALLECGQSYWLDNLTRRMIVSGELARRIKEEGLRGITANPTTFGQALTSDEYDEDIRALVERGKRTNEIYDHLLVDDVQRACDLLRDVHRDSGGVDGFVSLEVSPHLAYDPAGTMAETRRYVAAVGRPNLYIKIPGTNRGVAAIEQMLYEGVSINITLLFSVTAYQSVSEAYLTALERRVTEKQPIDRVASVASFFLSRIDVLVDQLLAQRRAAGDEARVSALRGQAAIASAKLAYRAFKRTTASERWEWLASKGARPQRLLWASTGTKNPAYRDVYYVEPLVGRETVNTMPEQTIAAFADHGEVRAGAIEEGVEQASATMRALTEIGIAPDSVAWQLEHEGVQKFMDAYDAAMKALHAKCEDYRGRKAA